MGNDEYTIRDVEEVEEARTRLNDVSQTPDKRKEETFSTYSQVPEVGSSEDLDAQSQVDRTEGAVDQQPLDTTAGAVDQRLDTTAEAVDPRLDTTAAVDPRLAVTGSSYSHDLELSQQQGQRLAGDKTKAEGKAGNSSRDLESSVTYSCFNSSLESSRDLIR